MTILPSISKKKSAPRKVRKSPKPERESALSLKRGALSTSNRAEPAAKKPTSSGDSASASTSAANLNSDDEYDEMEAVASNEQVEEEFAQRLAARGLVIKEMIGDGACMFRAIAEQVYGDQEMHNQIRLLCMDYMSKNRDYFHDFITEDFDQYIARKRQDTVHGNHLELQAISELFARPVEVYQYGDEPINILLPRGSGDGDEAGPSSHQQGGQPAQQAAQQNAPIRLSYHGAVHYNAIIDPSSPTIGVGLGLPGMSPKAAEKELVTSAMASSEREHIEETMLKDKLDMTDWQRTQADIEEQISRESYMSYLRDMENKKKSPTATKKSPPPPPTSSPTNAPICRRDDDDDDAPTTSSQAASHHTGGGGGLYEELLAAQSIDWDEDVSMAQALLLSQQEFLSAPGPSTSSPDKSL